MKIDYIKCGDYYLPNIVAPENITTFKIGRYGKLRLRYLKNYKKAEYTILLMDNRLQNHLMDIDKTANTRFELLVEQLKKQENVTETLKVNNQLEWIGKMNSIKNRVEEIILNELIYV